MKKAVGLTIVFILCFSMFSMFSPRAQAEATTTPTRLPYVLQGAASVWDGTDAYIFGGGSHIAGVTNQILKYNPDTDSISSMSALLPEPVIDFPAVWAGQYAYIFGGYVGPLHTSDNIVKYDLSTDTTTVMGAKVPTYSFPLYSMPAIWDGNYVYLFGGYDGYSYYDQILRYDPVNDQITMMNARLPTGTKWMPAVWSGTYAYVFGGRTASGASDQVVRYDPASDSITVMSARLPVGILVSSAVWAESCAYIFGGSDINNQVESTILRYDPSSDSITAVDSLPSPRRFTCAIWDGNSAYVFGGEDANGQDLDEIVKFTPPTARAPGIWTKCFGNPLNLGVSRVVEPWVIYDENMFKMWYVGITDAHRIYYATSPDGINWSPQGMVLDKGAGTWEEHQVRNPVVLHEGASYKMWYSGYNYGRAQIGFATSSDGIHWTKYYNNPVFVGGAGEWDSNVGTFKIIPEGNSYRMLYNGVGLGTQEIGVATSADGITWTRYVNNPVLMPGSSGWDNYHIYSGPVLKIGNSYNMWYSGQTGGTVQIGLATSVDGFSWSKYEDNPVISIGKSGTWDSEYVFASAVVERNDELLMWYWGGSNPAGGTESIGLAKSPSNQQLLVDGESNDGQPSLLQDKTGKLLLFFTSDRSGHYQIYVTTSVDRGETWCEPVLFSPSLDSRTILDPVSFQDSSGKIWVAWRIQNANTGDELWFTTSNDGLDWTQSKLLCSGQNDMGGFIEKDGKVWFFFSPLSNGWTVSYKTTYDGGATWSPIATATTSGGMRIPHVALLSNGTIMVVYRIGTSHYSANIGCSTSADSGTSWQEYVIDDPTYPGWDNRARIVEYRGRIIVFFEHYYDQSEPMSDIWYRTYYGGGWKSPGELTDDVAQDDYPWPTVVYGQLLIAWASRRSGNWDIWSSRFCMPAIDESPPTTILEIGQPKYQNLDQTFVTGDSLFTLIADDGLGSGVLSTSYRIFNGTYDSGWISYASPFNLSSFSDGSYSLFYNSTDNAGNVELLNTATIAVDNTPPSTSFAIGSPKYPTVSSTFVTSSTFFVLSASDGSGSGIASIFYRIWNDTYNSGWLTYSNPFYMTALSKGNYTISYYSKDKVGNREPEHTANITLFSWTSTFIDSYGRGTVLKINAEYKLFQFTAPGKDFSIKRDPKMITLCGAVVICYKDSEMQLAAAGSDGVLSFCAATAYDLQTVKQYLLIQKLVFRCHPREDLRP